MAPAAAAFSTKGMGAVFHVSMAHIANPKKILTKHLAQLLHPHACAVKWLDGVSALVLVRPDGATPVSCEAALAQIDKNVLADIEGLGFSKDYCVSCLRARKRNHATATCAQRTVAPPLSEPSHRH